MGKKTRRKEEHTPFSEPLLPFLATVVALLPLVMIPTIADVYALPKATFLFIATLALILAYLIRAVRVECIAVYRSVLDIPVLLLLVYATVSLALSDEPLLGLIGKYKRYEGLPALFCYGAIYFLSVQSVRGEKAFERMLKILTLGFIPVVVYGIIQWAGVDFPGVMRFEARVHSSLANPILLGAYLVIMLPLLVSLARSAPTENWRLLAWALIPVGFLNIVLTESRGAWLGLAIVVAAAFVLRWHQGALRARLGKRPSQPKNNRAMAAVAIAAVALVLVVALTPSSHLLERLGSTFAFHEGSAATRIETWKASVEMVGDRPLLGYGLEQMGYWFPLYKTERHIAVAPISLADRAHNDFLQVALDMGVPGLLLYLWMVVAALLYLLKHRKATYAAGLFVALIGYFAQAQTGIPAVFLTPFVWSLLGASVALPAGGRQLSFTVPRALRARVAVGVVTVAFAGLAIVSITPLIADYHMSAAQQTARVSREQAAPIFERALRTHPFQNAYAQAAAEFYLDYAAYSQNSIFAQRASLIAEQGLRYNTRDFELTYYVGETNFLRYRLTEDALALAKAQDYFELTEKLWPSIATVKSRLLEVALINGDEKRAVKKAREMVAMGEQDPQAYYVLAADAQRRGARDEAQRYLNEVERFAPGYLQKSNER